MPVTRAVFPTMDAFPSDTDWPTTHGGPSVDGTGRIDMNVGARSTMRLEQA